MTAGATLKHGTRRTALCVALVLASAVAPASAATTQPATATPQQVQDAIERGKKYIWSQLHGDTWESAPARDAKGKPSDFNAGQFGGLTSLATYTLLAAGENPQDPRLLKSLDFIRTADMVGTYALSFRALALLDVPKDPATLDAINKNAKALLAARRIKMPGKGYYGYLTGNGSTDRSTSEYAILGAWADSNAVPEAVPSDYWEETDALWRKDQGDDGGWTFRDKAGVLDSRGKPLVASAGMTAAGLATLFISQEYLSRGRGLNCAGNQPDKNIDLGLAWLSNYYKHNTTRSLSANAFYDIESAGAASGYKYFGDTDWYQNGANFLVQQQQKDGSFRKDTFWPALANTCFAMLFLSRGRAPIMMNKLNYDLNGSPASWNQRSRDVANIAHWVGQQTENTLNWQTTTLGSPVVDWHDAPILYISGDQSLNFTPAQVQKLKTFIEQGGLILANADCGKADFVDSFRKLGSAMFSDYEFKQLANDSVILHDEQYAADKWHHPVPIFGMDNGARQLMLLIPDADPSRAWQMRQSAGKEELFQLAADVFLYSVDKDQLVAKGDPYVVEPDPKIQATKSIDIQRIQYGGNSNPEPGGWTRLSAVLHNNDHIDLNVALTDPSKISGSGVAHLTGTAAFKFNSDQLTAIKAFVQSGGTLVVDAAGGSAAFADSAERFLAQLFGSASEQLKRPLPENHPLYETGGPLGDVGYRAYARTKIVGNLRGPRLRGITQGSRLVCIFSREDLSVGLVGEPVDGIIGYSPATATALMRKIILYATHTATTVDGINGIGSPTALRKSSTQPTK